MTELKGPIFDLDYILIWNYKKKRWEKLKKISILKKCLTSLSNWLRLVFFKEKKYKFIRENAKFE